MPTMSPMETLEVLQRIEEKHGRIRGEKWGPRTLDLDLLSWPGETIEHERLTLPHPRIAERGFVLIPWATIAPDLVPFGMENSVE